MIDKKIEGVYDLDVVDIHRQSYETSQPLLNAVNSQRAFSSWHTDGEPNASTLHLNHTDQDTGTMISFQDNFVHTNALLRA